MPAAPGPARAGCRVSSSCTATCRSRRRSTKSPATAPHPIAVLVPDHRDDGTPVCSVPVAAPFDFAYGAGSFARHGAAAARAELDVRVVRDPTLAFDVDVPEDLARLDTTPTP